MWGCGVGDWGYGRAIVLTCREGNLGKEGMLSAHKDGNERALQPIWSITFRQQGRLVSREGWVSKKRGWPTRRRSAE